MRTIDNSGSNESGTIKMSANTAVKFYYKTKQYQTGIVGTKNKWTKFWSSIDDTDLDVFWVDWQGSYGSQQLKAMSMGVYDLCRLRMDFHPEIYRMLQTREVIIIKNASRTAINEAGEPILSDPDVYTLWGAVDDIGNRRRIMEFKVRRFEAK